MSCRDVLPTFVGQVLSSFIKCDADIVTMNLLNSFNYSCIFNMIVVSPLVAHNITLKKVKTLFVARKFDVTKEHKQHHTRGQLSFSTPIVQLASSTSIDAFSQERKDQSANIFQESKKPDKQMYKEWHKDQKNHVLSGSICGKLEAMTNYMKKITKEANRIRRLQGSQPSARRNALNNYMTPSKNLITEYTSQSSKSIDGEATYTNIQSKSPCNTFKSSLVKLSTLPDARQNRKHKRAQVTYESQTKQQLLESMETLHTTIESQIQPAHEQLQDRFKKQVYSWQGINDIITNQTLRKSPETLFSRLAEWRSHVEDKEKVESLKDDVHFLGNNYFNSTLRQDNYQQRKIQLSQNKPHFDLNFTRQSKPHPESLRGLLSTPSPINRYIPAVQKNLAIDDFQNGQFFKRISKSKKEVEIVRCPLLNGDLSNSNIRSQLFLNRKPNLTQQTLKQLTTPLWANPGKQIDALQINGENVLKKEWRSLRDDKNNNKTLFSIIKQVENLDHLNESIDQGYV